VARTKETPGDRAILDLRANTTITEGHKGMLSAFFESCRIAFLLSFNYFHYNPFYYFFPPYYTFLPSFTPLHPYNFITPPFYSLFHFIPTSFPRRPGEVLRRGQRRDQVPAQSGDGHLLRHRHSRCGAVARSGQDTAIRGDRAGRGGDRVTGGTVTS